MPESGHLKVREGDTVELLCNVSGNPAPSLSWSRHDTPLPTSPGCDSCLRIAEVGPQHSGAYDCSANNGIQPSASAVINLHVECKEDTQRNFAVKPYEGKIHRRDNRSVFFISLLLSYVVSPLYRVLLREFWRCIQKLYNSRFIIL